MTCRACIGYRFCSIGRNEQTNFYGKESACNNVEDLCSAFKNKADFVELPFVAMVDQFIKDGKFDKKHTAHNGRFAVVYIDKSKWNCPLIDITEQFYNDEKARERIRILKGGADNG